MRFSHWILAIVAVALLLPAVFVAAPRAVVAQDDKNVSPKAGPPGTEFTFFATGYDGEERVGYWFNDPDGRIYSDSHYKVFAYQGRADWSWEVPENAKPGTWTAVAQGQRSDHEQTIPFEVTGTGASTPDQGDMSGNVTVGVDPAIGQPNGRFDFVVVGMPSHETIIYWAIMPNGQVWNNKEERTTANADGRADWEWNAPDNAMPGTWRMVIEGRENGMQSEISFEIVNPNAEGTGEDEGDTPPTDTPPADPPPTTAPGDVLVDPPSGHPGSGFAFVLAGLPPREVVHFWFVDPAGVIYVSRENRIETGDNGNASWVWVAPQSVAPGRWRLVAIGEYSGIQKEVAFEIQ